VHPDLLKAAPLPGAAFSIEISSIEISSIEISSIEVFSIEAELLLPFVVIDRQEYAHGCDRA
jgi:hypothetical protein